MARLRSNPEPAIIMLTPTETAEIGERHVEQWLTAQGWRCHAGAQRHGAAMDIEAHGQGDDGAMLVHVLCHLSSAQAPELSQMEQDSVCARAILLEAEPWLAEVCIDRSGDLVGEIQWRKLG